MIKHFSIPVTELSTAIARGSGTFSAWLHESETLPVVIVLSGGGYYMQSQAEGAPVAQAFSESGYQAFYLNYSLLPYTYPAQLLEAAAAVQYLRDNHESLGVDPKRIALCGFSAGAHLSACLSNMWNSPPVANKFPDCAPNAVILSYPVTGSGLDNCDDMYISLCAGERTFPDEVVPEKTAGRHTPPTFLWHTADDPVVDVRHSLGYAARLKALGIPFELHIFPNGPHAMSLCIPETAYSSAHINPHAAQWFPLALNWLKKTL